MLKNLLLSLILSNIILSQDLSEFKKILDFKNNVTAIKSFENDTLVNLSLLSIPFKLYKILLSNQDLDRCEFYPSCSHFSFLALKKAGLFKGYFLTFDRLSRNGSTGEYNVLENYGYFDPIENYLR
jgi:putative component of membrane protein insertase Oxa1/YidC/SpoIIIJ protein YidD